MAVIWWVSRLPNLVKSGFLQSNMGRILATHGLSLTGFEFNSLNYSSGVEVGLLSLTGSEFNSLNYSSGVEGGWLSLTGSEFNSLNYSFVIERAVNIHLSAKPTTSRRRLHR